MSATKCVTLLINSMRCSLLLHCFCCPIAVCEGFGLVLLFFLTNAIAMISLSYILADAYGMVIRCNGTTEGGREGRREGGWWPGCRSCCWQRAAITRQRCPWMPASCGPNGSAAAAGAAVWAPASAPKFHPGAPRLLSFTLTLHWGLFFFCFAPSHTARESTRRWKGKNDELRRGRLKGVRGEKRVRGRVNEGLARQRIVAQEAAPAQKEKRKQNRNGSEGTRVNGQERIEKWRNKFKA